MSDDNDELSESITEAGMRVLEETGTAHRELEDASDEELVRLLFAYDGKLHDTSSVTSNAMATFILRERGYDVGNQNGELTIVDPDGNTISPDDISE